MPVISIETEINAERGRVFDLSRSIDLHKISTEHTNEQAIDGRISGLINLDETVTWNAKHLGVYQKLTTRITEFQYPGYFVDEMVSGAFKCFYHKHEFISLSEQKTLMTDTFDFESPLGLLGHLANRIFLTGYMTRLLEKRNEVIKQFAEGDEWKLVLDKEHKG